jgi:hypothetical protein
VIRSFISSARTTSRRIVPAVGALTAATSMHVSAQQITAAIAPVAFEASSAVAVIVKVPKPWYAPKSAVVSKMRDTMAQYDSVPGLAFKAFSLAQADNQFGGIYLWKDLASAKAWFSPAWFERVEKERGAKGDVRFFEVPVAIDNTPGGTPMNADSPGVGTLVTITKPQGVTKQRLFKEFEAAIPIYQKVPGLLRKYFIVTEDGKFGGIYIWKDQASAREWLSDGWRDRVLRTYGAQPTIEWFDTPILLPSKSAENRVVVPGL